MKYKARVMDDLSRAAEALRAEWISAREMQSICPTCAASMQAKNISRVKASWIVDKMIVAFGWDSLPDGWTKESVKKYWDSMTGDKKHKVTDCIKKMTPHFGKDGAGGFCASIEDMIKGTTDWRGKE